MDCILICILFKFGEYICYSSRDLGFFLWGYFFWCARTLDMFSVLPRRRLASWSVT